ncbi:RNA polymerase sigma factor [Phaeodactylibacter xiamenensis]|jgi:RNA polymerase sigma-70 factor (ECF subfamily)|uniref:RNA polymerase sigma factor n=1 Tax=Phaeodactylibacter xiamenensis TaxID=1524460 RepID=UPI0005C66B6A|nr:sigma-70 family RNA polymerase sigma factor [Phaeodactylibacter xiamenensis]MCR9051098.1 sigma-70 family RNA polymerase sigma factor [bacterium]
MATKINEEKLVRRLQARDKSAIAEVYDAYAPSLYGIALHIVRSEAIAQDVVQETFIKVWKNAATYDTRKGTLFTWLLNITRNGAIDKTRSAAFRRRRQNLPVDEHLKNNHKLSTAQNTDQIGLRSFVNQLEEKYRDIIELAYFQGYTQQEIAEDLDLPIGTVKSRVRIGLRELRKIFSEPGLTHLLIAAFCLSVYWFVV